jgi:elongation factor Ts
MAITAKEVNELRQKTGLGMMECKQALGEANGDVQAAVDLLRKKGLAKMDSRADRASAEGRVGAAVSADKSVAAIIEVNTETDFTAGNDGFKAMIAAVAAEALKQPAGAVTKTDAMQAIIDEIRLTTKENVQFSRGTVIGGPGQRVGMYVHFTGKIAGIVQIDPAGQTITDELVGDICQHIAAAVPPPIAVDESGVPAELIEKEKAIAKGQALEQGKPEAIAEKMVTGKIRKFYEENCLKLQAFIKDDKKRIHELLPKGATLVAFGRYQLGGK